MMMWEVAIVAAGIAVEAHLDAEFERSLLDVSPEVAMKLRRDRQERKERARQEAIVERRHREQVAALDRIATSIAISRI